MNHYIDNYSLTFQNLYQKTFNLYTIYKSKFTITAIQKTINLMLSSLSELTQILLLFNHKYNLLGSKLKSNLVEFIKDSQFSSIFSIHIHFFNVVIVPLAVVKN